MEPTKKGIKRKSTILSYYTKTPKVQTDNLGENDKLNETEVVVSLAESALTPFNHNSQSMSEQHNENNKLIEPSASALPSAHQTVITPTQIDIGLFIGQFEQPTSQVNSSHRYNILKNTFNPDTTFKFPGSGKRNLKFQINWLSRWKWLAYSVSCDGAFCKYCMLFCPKEVNTQKLGQLVFEKFTHEFLSVFENKQESIAVKLDSKLKLEIEKNRKMIRPIIETILLCGRQGIALRGHTDSGPIDLSSLFLSNNEGNFRVILKYVLMNSKDELKNCFENLPKNATYISPDIQNEIINVINSLVIKKLVTKINQAKCFTILADETTDVAGIEQFSMCVRETSSKANSILFSLKQGETLLSIHILAKVFSLSMPLSRQLQKEDIDLSISMELADNVMSAVCLLRTNAAEEFKIIYSDVEKKYIEADEVSAIGEFTIWHHQVKNKNPKNATEAFINCNEEIFPTVHQLLKILITLPVTTASSERSFSSLRRLKTYLRNTTGENRLNGLAVMNIHRDLVVTTDEIIDTLALKNRRIKLI
ncbi:unnamed protein product [Macrosiphum euphorbiae]|uniref:Uncharacterized protein n=1 Tax=Macrosiphum euphorbiae TaxID=13131 RepID=A0AAV0Y5G0_9HEMI|nr:unnamed protein product [Macrosiphum euphorbiae]